MKKTVVNPNDWVNFDREDLKMIPQAMAAGWTVGFNYKDVSADRITPEKPPLFEVHFDKGLRSVWKASVYWTTGVLGHNGFHDKKTLKSLNEMLKL